jgi:hypothetical protein
MIIHRKDAKYAKKKMRIYLGKSLRSLRLCGEKYYQVIDA